MMRFFAWIYSLFACPKAVCSVFDHDVGSWMETSGRGQFAKCKRCGEDLHRPEFS